MRASRPSDRPQGPLLTALVLAVVAVLSLAVRPDAVLAQTDANNREQNFGDQGWTRVASQIWPLTRSQPRYQYRTETRSRMLRQGGVPASLGLAHPTMPRPKGSDARICANQTEGLASYRITSCTKIINSGRLRDEALGVAYGLRGLAHLDRGDIPHAIGDLNRAVDLAPDFAPAYQNRGNAWYARGSYGQALADYDKTIALDPNSPSPYVNRAAIRRDLGFNDGALADYQKAIALRPGHAASYNGRGQLYMRLKDYAHATADFDSAVSIDPTAENYMLRAQAREAAGDLDSALNDFQQAARLDPKDVAPLNAQAAIWRKKGDLNKTIAVLDRAIQLNENPALTYRLRSESYRDKGDRKRAYADIGRALKYSWSVNGLRVRGNMRLQDGDTDGALHDAESMLKIETDNRDAIALRAMAYTRKKDFARALPDLDKVIAADANDALAYAMRGQIYLAKNDTAHALTDFDRAINLHVTSTEPYLARAKIRKSKGDSAKAMSDLDQAIKLDPKPAEPYFERAGLRKAKGDSAGALADLDAALARNPKNSEMLRARATVLIQTKAYAKAIGDLDRAILSDPNGAEAYYQRGLAREKSGDSEKAVADYKLALARDSNMNEARTALASALAVKDRKHSNFATRKNNAKQTKQSGDKRKIADLAVPQTETANAGAADVDAASPPLPEVRPDLTPDSTTTVPAAHGKTVPRDIHQNKKHRETARERARREYEARENVRLERKKRSQRTQHAATSRSRALSPSEKRRLHSQAQAERRRDTRFTDIWNERR